MRKFVLGLLLVPVVAFSFVSSANERMSARDKAQASFVPDVDAVPADIASIGIDAVIPFGAVEVEETPALPGVEYAVFTYLPESPSTSTVQFDQGSPPTLLVGKQHSAVLYSIAAAVTAQQGKQARFQLRC